jgi:hypothetical protein
VLDTMATKLVEKLKYFKTKKLHISPTYAKFGRSCDISYSIRKKLGLSKVEILINISPQLTNLENL